MKKTNRRSKQSSPIDASASDANKNELYKQRIRELEQENKAYKMEIEELRQQQGSDSSASNNGVEKLKKDYLPKLNLLEEQVTELKKKLGSQSQFSTHRKRVDESTKQLQFEIQTLKAQKVQLQCKIKLQSVQFRLCKALLEKEVQQLKKEGRRNEFNTHSLLASNERLKRVLQRKTEEASTANKRLGDLIAVRKVISNRSAGARNRNGQIIQDAEHELGVTTQLHKLCSQYESEMEKMAEEIAQLKEEIEMHRQEKLRFPLQEDDCDSPDKDSDIQDLKEQVNSLSCLLRELQLRKEKPESKDKKQVWAIDIKLEKYDILLPDESNDKIKMDTPKMNSSSENNVKRESTAEGLCCSCSKKSLCKTTKCRCRSSGAGCGASCGCTRSKCTNRELSGETENDPPKSENTEGIMNASAVDKNGNIIASECAKLLQSALVQKPASSSDNPGLIKKPLRDIQNSLGQLDAQRQGKKKKARKPVIHIVTKDSPENNSSTEAYKIETQENNAMKLDKAKKAATDSNSGQPNELATAISDAAGFRQLRNPTRQAKSAVGKENCFV
ncbi:kinesin-like protein KIN-4C [Gastrolobium bilobum]|uniref:kinesin-like protein KIN-4C n=1 Tax=Gastrolobium bilobum TaxID=150636 RepID=UPI002AB172D9|nr:kinesin-like protein KIN-4C [Gastrolobium bilobum]